MVLGKRWLFSIGNGPKIRAKIRPVEKGRKSPVYLFLDKDQVAEHLKQSEKRTIQPKQINTF